MALVTGIPMDRTNAERQRRYIARLKAAAAQSQPGVTNAAKPDGRDARALEAALLYKQNNEAYDEIVRLKKRVGDLEAELARAKKMPPPLTAADFSPERKQAAAEQRKAKRAAKRAAVGLAVEEPETIEGGEGRARQGDDAASKRSDTD